MKASASLIPYLLLPVLLSGWSTSTSAHAFPQEQAPGAGKVVHNPPDKVRIRFNAALEPVFSKLWVEDAQGQQLSETTRVNPDKPKLLQAPLPNLEEGTYRVYWRAVARDGHRTQGDYTFTVRP